MTSTETLSKTIASRMKLPAVLAPKAKNPWPNPLVSIGKLLCPLGRNKCWEAIGPAGELSRGNLFKDIKRLLESRHEYLNEGESVFRALLFEVYMIGRNEALARPTILFCCERKPPRQRALKLVKESPVLVGYPGVQLGDCSRPPGLTRQPVPLFDPAIANSDQVPLDDLDLRVQYQPPINTLSGIPVYVDLPNGKPRAATIGGFLCVGDKLAALTVRHVFDGEQDELDPENLSTDLEFSLDFDHEEEIEGDEDSEFVTMTSTGSISPSHIDSDDSEPSVSTGVPTITRHDVYPPYKSRASDVSSGSGQDFLGHVQCRSIPNGSENTDWALISLKLPLKVEIPPLLNHDLGISTLINDARIVETLPSMATPVLIPTGLKGLIQGTISGNLSFVRMGGNAAFQEMWTVHLDEPLMPGDCGSWVKDAKSGAWYGHIVAGDQGASVAYITPGKQIFGEIGHLSGRKVTFPSASFAMNYLSQRSEPDAPELDTEMADSSTPPGTQPALDRDVKTKPESSEDIKIKIEPQSQYEFENLLESLMPAGIKIEDMDSDISNIVHLPERNKLFEYREDELREIHQILSIQAVCCLTGAAGAGKTEIALEYAHKHKDTYSEIFWITNPSIILQETFGKIGIEDWLDSIHERSEQDKKRWLAILDNVEGGLEIKFLLYKWNLGQGSVLITTRQREFAIPSGILWYRKEIWPFSQYKTKTSSAAIRESDFLQEDFRAPKRFKTEQLSKKPEVFDQAPNFEVVKETPRSTTSNPVSLMSDLVDSHVQAYKVSPIAPKPVPTGDSTIEHLKPTENFRKRTKTGCLTCRKRRIKCGEERPTCFNCIKSKRSCEGYNQRVVFKDPLNFYRPVSDGTWNNINTFSENILNSGSREDILTSRPFNPPQAAFYSSTIQSVPPTETIEEIDDEDPWDVSSEASTALDPSIEPSSEFYDKLEKNDIGNVVALQAGQERESPLREFSSLETSTMLTNYTPLATSSPLTDSITARIFCYFVSVVAPTLSMYERHPSNPSLVFEPRPVPKSQQHIWTYVMPTQALTNRSLLHSILAVGSLYMALMQDAPKTASLKHYALALRRVQHDISDPSRRQAPATLAACLLLGWYEFVSPDHGKWSFHLQGSSVLLRESNHAVFERHRVKNFGDLAKNWNFTTLSGDKTSQSSDEFLRKIFGESLYDDSREATMTQSNISFSNEELELSQSELAVHETKLDLFWWFCKHDISQSILGGTPLTLPYKCWATWSPRAPFGQLNTIHGTSDHLILLLGRTCNFAAGDLERKLSNLLKENGTYLHPDLIRFHVPLFEEDPIFPDWSRAAEILFEECIQFTSPLKANAELALKEWADIRAVFKSLRICLGPDFAPLAPEVASPSISPFGPALIYRTHAVAGIWLNFNMGMIITGRAHPFMPPMAMSAARIAAPVTSGSAVYIGQIAAGISPDLSQLSEVSPATAAALIESCLPLFVAAIQYTDTSQRQWVVQRFSDIARLTGFKTATSFSQGCEAAWIKYAETGRGPPYTRADDGDHLEGLAMRLTRVSDAVPADDGVKLVLQRADRVHYALGLLGVENDLENLDIEGH